MIFNFAFLPTNRFDYFYVPNMRIKIDSACITKALTIKITKSKLQILTSNTGKYGIKIPVLLLPNSV